MAITGNSSYFGTTADFTAHWAVCDEETAPQVLLVQLPDDTTMSQPQFEALRGTLQAQQFTVQRRLTGRQIARSGIESKKTALLKRFTLFTSLLDGYFRNTDFYDARPYAPSIGDGQEKFTQPMLDATSLWETINEGPAPAGVTLPLVLADGTDHTAFADEVSALQAAYKKERREAQKVTLARAARNRIQTRAYAAMKAYREAVPGVLAQFPDLVNTLPRLTPLPGHTPDAVKATGEFVAPDQTRVVYGASDDPTLLRYELRGTVGDHYDPDDDMTLGTHGPNDPREFLITFGLTQPGAQIALKVYVILTTGNEAGSAAMLVERPLAQAA